MEELDGAIQDLEEAMAKRPDLAGAASILNKLHERRGVLSREAGAV